MKSGLSWAAAIVLLGASISLGLRSGAPADLVILVSLVFGAPLGLIFIALYVGGLLHSSASRRRRLPTLPFYALAFLLVIFSFVVAFTTVAGIMSLKPGSIGDFEVPANRVCGAIFVVAVGISLYTLRSLARVVYGVLEFAFASVSCWQSISYLRQEQVNATIAVAASAYLVVRGCDNIVEGWKVIKGRRAEQQEPHDPPSVSTPLQPASGG
jgi:hypothetical protein